MDVALWIVSAFFNSLKLIVSIFLKKESDSSSSSSPSPRAHNKFYQVVEAKRFEGVFLCRKVC